MKLKMKLVLTLGLCLISALCFAVGCENNSSAADAPQGEAYEWTFDKPFAGEPDEYMTIDGKLDEDVWKEKQYLTQNIKSVSWQATTHFTEKGLYVAVKATDDTMSYNTRFTSRSAFYVYICKTGTQTYNINSLAYHQGRCFQFQLDPFYCRSMERVPYYYKAYVDGELNSETTCTMTAELFLTWKDLYYTQEELGENGYPEDIQMYVNYEGEKKEILGTCLWREETYLHFDKNGYKTASEYNNGFGNMINGLASTDMWSVNDEGNYYTTAGRAQIMWINNAYAKDFVFEAKLKPLSTNIDGSPITLRGQTVYGRFGLINENPNGDYTVYSADARKAPISIQLQTCRQIDSFHWQNLIGLKSGDIAAESTDEFITLRVIKQGDMFYYFYGDTYWKSERISDMADETYCGIFSSQGVEILDYYFKDYTNEETVLLEELSKYMYFIEVPGVSTYGSVSVSSYTVAKGEPVTVTFAASSKGKGILTKVTKNGTDVYDEIVAEMNENCEYTFIPTEDTTFGATFSSFNSDALVKTVIVYKDENGQVKDGNYEIRGSNKLLYYSGTPNTSGNVIVYLPKAGTYKVGQRTFEVSGEYNLFTSFSNNHDYTLQFTLNEDTTSTDIYGKEESVAENKSFTIHATVSENLWGAVEVNGIKISGSGTLKYNEDTGNYYAIGSVNRYYKNTVAMDFKANITISATDIGHSNNDLAGITITNGKYLIVLKVNLNNGGNLIIATGSGTVTTTKELCITNFGWGNTITLPTAESKGSGTFTFSILKSGNAIYLFNKDGVLCAYLNENGLNLVNSAITWGKENLNDLNAHIGKLFVNGNETVIGARVYLTKSIRAEYDIEFAHDLIEEDKAAISYGDFYISLADGVTLNESLYAIKDGYAKGETITLAVNVSNIKIRKVQLLLESDESVKIIDGVYDYENKCYVFTFLYDGGDINARVCVLSEGDMGWSDDWNDFVPDRENTMPSA